MKRLRAACLLVWATCLLAGPALAYGPSTLYVPSEGAPAGGCLYARAVQLRQNGPHNGKIYATFEQYTHDTPVFPIYESTDDGEHWTRVGSVCDQENGWGMRFQPFLFELPRPIGDLPAGTLLCAGNSIPQDGSKTKLDIYQSTDLGRTWCFVSSVASGGVAKPGGGTPVWEPFLLMPDGRLICYFSDERDPRHSQKIVHRTSTDGVTWGPVVDDIALPDTRKRPGMPVVTRMQDGRYLLIYEIVGAPRCATYYQVSADPERWDATSMGTHLGRGGTPYVVTLADGTLVAGCGGGRNLYTNASNGEGPWATVPSSLAGGYSRCLVPLRNGRLFLITAGHRGAKRKAVRYADMEPPHVPSSP